MGRSAAGELLFQNGTLSGVTDEGTLDLSANGSRLTVNGAGITLTGTGGTGLGDVLLTGGNSYLSFTGTQTFDNATVSIGGTGGAGFLEASGAGSTLTLGANLTVTQTGGARLYAATGDAIVNTGTITAGATNGTMLLLGGGSFTNQSTINVSNGDDFDVAAVAFANSGTIIVSSGGSLVAGSSVLGAGTIDLKRGGVVAFSSAVASGEIVQFLDASTSKLTLSQPGGFLSTIAGMRPSDTVDVRTIGLAASYSYSAGTLTLKNSGGTAVATLSFSTPVINPQFTLGTDGSGGTILGLLQGATVTGTYTNGIVLSNPATQNPTTVTASGYVTNTTTAHNGDAVYGTTAAAWNVSNYGTLNAAGALSNGVFLSAGGTVANQISGSIAGGVHGVNITGGPGTVNNLGTILNIGDRLW